MGSDSVTVCAESKNPPTDSAVARVGQAPESTAAYLRRLGLGTKATVFFVFSAAEPGSLQALPFYRRLTALPGLDKVKGRLIALTYGGAVPAMDRLRAEGLTVHRAGSFPEDPAGLPTEVGSIAVLDSNGKILRTWAGFPTKGQQDEIVEFISAALK